MSGPRDLTLAELQRFGLGIVQMCGNSSEPVTRIYCRHCGTQVSEERREVDPHGWWSCVRKCNTQYAEVLAHRPARPSA